MTVYEKIQTFDIVSMAEFIYTLINDTELKMLNSLSKQGIDARLVDFGKDARINENVEMLLQEVDDDS